MPSATRPVQPNTQPTQAAKRRGARPGAPLGGAPGLCRQPAGSTAHRHRAQGQLRFAVGCRSPHAWHADVRTAYPGETRGRRGGPPERSARPAGHRYVARPFSPPLPHRSPLRLKGYRILRILLARGRRGVLGLRWRSQVDERGSASGAGMRAKDGSDNVGLWKALERWRPLERVRIR